MDWIRIAIGLAVLLVAGDILVKGAVNLSLRLGIPALIVSLTIVAFGTSAPELLIAVQSVVDGAPGLAIGNVVGSNIANVLLVLGLPAMISRLHTSDLDTRRTYGFMMVGSVLLTVACFLTPIRWWGGLILLAALGAVLFDSLGEARANRAAQPVASDEVEGADPGMAWWKIGLFLVLGLVGLPIGANQLVEGAVSIARQYGVSEAVIGLTLVAVGTSLPELATTVMAALRRNADVAMGNVIGSNMFNALAIVGIAALFGPIPVDKGFLHFDLWVMLASSLALAPFVLWGRNLTRRYGVLFVALYAAYVLAVLS